MKDYRELSAETAEESPFAWGGLENQAGEEAETAFSDGFSGNMTDRADPAEMSVLEENTAFSHGMGADTASASASALLDRYAGSGMDGMPAGNDGADNHEALIDRYTDMARRQMTQEMGEIGAVLTGTEADAEPEKLLTLSDALTMTEDGSRLKASEIRRLAQDSGLSADIVREDPDTARVASLIEKFDEDAPVRQLIDANPWLVRALEEDSDFFEASRTVRNLWADALPTADGHRNGSGNGETGFLESVRLGYLRGVQQTAAAEIGAGAVLEVLTGQADETKVRAWREAVSQAQAKEREYGDDSVSWYSLGTAAEQFHRMATADLPMQLAGALAAAGLAVTAGLPVAGAAAVGAISMGVWQSIKTEMGAYFAERLTEKDDAGQYLPTEDTAKAAALYGVTAGIIEGISEKAFLNLYGTALKPLADSVGAVLNKQFGREVFRRAAQEPALRTPVIHFANALLRGAFIEGTEEGAQALAEQVTDMISDARMREQNKIYRMEINAKGLDLAEAFEQAKAGAGAGMWFGMIPGTIRTVRDMTREDRAERLAAAHKEAQTDRARRLIGAQSYAELLTAQGMGGMVRIDGSALASLDALNGGGITTALRLETGQLERMAENGESLDIPLADVFASLDSETFAQVSPLLRQLDQENALNETADLLREAENGTAAASDAVFFPSGIADETDGTADLAGDITAELSELMPEMSEQTAEQTAEQAQEAGRKAEALQSVLNQLNGMGETAGRTQFNGTAEVIELMTGADASALPHEIGHVFFRHLEEAAGRNMGSQARADMEALRIWSLEGMPNVMQMSAEERARRTAERVADGFTLYLEEGRAPTRELKEAFERFREVLVRLWQTVRQIFQAGRVQLSRQAEESFAHLLNGRRTSTMRIRAMSSARKTALRTEMERLRWEMETADIDPSLAEAASQILESHYTAMEEVYHADALEMAGRLHIQRTERTEQTTAETMAEMEPEERLLMSAVPSDSSREADRNENAALNCEATAEAARSKLDADTADQSVRIGLEDAQTDFSSMFRGELRPAEDTEGAEGRDGLGDSPELETEPFAPDNAETDRQLADDWEAEAQAEREADEQARKGGRRAKKAREAERKAQAEEDARQDTHRAFWEFLRGRMNPDSLRILDEALYTSLRQRDGGAYFIFARSGRGRRIEDLAASMTSEMAEASGLEWSETSPLPSLLQALRTLPRPRPRDRQRWGWMRWQDRKARQAYAQVPEDLPAGMRSAEDWRRVMETDPEQAAELQAYTEEIRNYRFRGQRIDALLPERAWEDPRRKPDDPRPEHVRRAMEEGRARRQAVRSMIQAEAADMLNRLPFAEAVNSWRLQSRAQYFLRLERSALASGRFGEASRFNVQARFYFEAAAESARMRDRFEKAMRTVRRFIGNSKVSADPRYVVRRLALRIGLIPQDLGDHLDLNHTADTVRDWYAAHAETEGTDGGFTPSLIEGEYRWQDMKPAEVSEACEEINRVMALTFSERYCFLNGKRRRYEAVKERLLEGMLQLSNNAIYPLRSPLDRETPLRRLLHKADAAHLKLDTIFLELDGGKEGIFTEIFTKTINRMSLEETDRKDQASKALGRMFNVYYPSEMERMRMRTEKHETAVGQMTREQALCALLNCGNTQNLGRLLRGMHWTRSDLNSVLSLLTENDARFCQGIWDYLDTFREEAFALQERMTGVRPTKVLASPFTMPNGVTLRGGYYPIAYDRRMMRNPEKADPLGEVVYSPNAFVQSGAMKERGRGLEAPLELSLDVLSEHVTGMVHTLAMRESTWLISRLLTDQEVRGAILRKTGHEVFRALLDRIRTIAGKEEQKTYYGMWASRLRHSAALYTMGYKLSTALAQMSGVLYARHEIGTRWTVQGISDTLNGGRIWDSLEKAREESVLMRHRIANTDREIQEMSTGMTEFGSSSNTAVLRFSQLRRSVERHAFELMGHVQLLCADLPTYYGARARWLNLHPGDVSGAVAYAERIVERTQGGGMKKDLAGVQTGNEMAKLMTMYYGFFSVMYQLFHRRVMGIRHARNRKEMLNAAMRMGDMLVLGLMLESVLTAFVQGKDPGDDAETPEDFLAFYAHEAVTSPFQMFVGVRDVANAIDRGISGKGFSFSLPAFAPLEALASFMTQSFNLIPNLDDPKKKDVLSKWASAGAKSFGYATGLWNAQTQLTAEAFFDWLNDEDEDFELYKLIGRKNMTPDKILDKLADAIR